MGNYRPLCDTWILARSKVKYYGAYPAGFLDRARALLGVTIQDSVLHACSGMVRDYPFKGFGRHDKTMDIDPSLDPDFLQDVRSPWPLDPKIGQWRGILADPPYTPEDAEHYVSGSETFPNPNEMVKLAYEALRPGGRFGILHYVWPRPPEGMKNIAVISVLVGFNNRARLYSVYEKE